MEYTVEVYKQDRRFKEGEHMVNKLDLDLPTVEAVQARMYWIYRRANLDGLRWVIHETYVTRKNLMSGSPVKERYDQPYHCSVASESYWSQ